jgi:nucleoside-diphosphate-sugar epimerase
MNMRIAVTGSAGLIGRAFLQAARDRSWDARGLDLRASGDEHGDIRQREADLRLCEGRDGVVHLAAVSRVLEAESDPEHCWDVNVRGTTTLLDAARAQGCRWLLYASSREVYGQATSFPVAENAPLCPVNQYGRSKLAAERAVGSFGASIRLSNVYGSVHDYADRVVPAYIQAARNGRPLRVDGADSAFDFVHLDDAVSGLLAACLLLQSGSRPQPLQLTTGTATELASLARLVAELVGVAPNLEFGPPRACDVHRFCGSPVAAFLTLGWFPRVALREGLQCLIADYVGDPSPSRHGP